MHPLASYDLARIKIQDLHAEAARERLAAEARAALDPAREQRRERHLSLAQPLGLLRRIVHRGTPAPAGAGG